MSSAVAALTKWSRDTPAVFSPHPTKLRRAGRGVGAGPRELLEFHVSAAAQHRQLRKAR